MHMGIFKKLFGIKHILKPPTPIFPAQTFTIFKLTFPDGWGLATVNKAYDNYPNKHLYPWQILIEIEVIDQNVNGHPTDSEASKLNIIAEELENLLKQSQTVHLVARIMRRGFRDLIYYIDQPNFKQNDLNAFCIKIRKERQITFSVHEDPSWKSIAFIK
jgi:Family of unknown function (DUF695)